MTLSQLNQLSLKELEPELHKCCGSTTWVNNMAAIFPVRSMDYLLNQSDNIWEDCTEEDAREAFSNHPKIGDLSQLKEKFEATSEWAAGEQEGVQHTTTQVLEALAESNQEYETKFGFIFIVCASGMLAEEMLSLLKLRLLNSREDEISIAMEEQNKITRLRLKKLVS